MEEWAFVDERELQGWKGGCVCITCQHFTYGVDQHCHTLLGCNLRQQQLQQGEQFSLHALGKRNIEEGTKWLLHRDRETYNWWLADEQDQQLPTDAERLGARVLKHVQRHGYQSINEIVSALGGNAEHARLVCFDMFEQGRLQRHQRRTGKRGRPEYLYGVGDFSHVTHTPPADVTAGA